MTRGGSGSRRRVPVKQLVGFDPEDREVLLGERGERHHPPHAVPRADQGDVVRHRREQDRSHHREVTRLLLSREHGVTIIAAWPIAGAVFLGTIRQAPVAAYADGAPSGFTGGFKQQAGDACHFEAALNSAPGQATLTGVPERYVAGQQYPLTVTLSRPGMVIGGFQLAARLVEGGAQAGALAPAPGDETRIRIEPGAIQTPISDRRARRSSSPASRSGRWSGQLRRLQAKCSSTSPPTPPTTTMPRAAITSTRRPRSRAPNNSSSSRRSARTQRRRHEIPELAAIVYRHPERRIGMAA